MLCYVILCYVISYVISYVIGYDEYDMLCCWC